MGDKSVVPDNITLTLKPTLAGGIDIGLDEIPTSYSVGLDLGLDDIRIKELPPINLDSDSKVNLKSDSKVSLKSDSGVRLNSDSAVKLNSESGVKLNSDSKLDLGLDNLRIKELPLINFQLGLKQMKLSFPLHYKLSFSLFGLKLFEFDVSGENKVIAEDL